MRRIQPLILTFTAYRSLWPVRGAERGSGSGLPQDLAVADMAGCPTDKPPAATITVRRLLRSAGGHDSGLWQVRWQFMAGGTHGVFPAGTWVFQESPVQSSGTYELCISQGRCLFDYGCAIRGATCRARLRSSKQSRKDGCWWEDGGDRRGYQSSESDIDTSVCGSGERKASFSRANSRKPAEAQAQRTEVMGRR